MLGAELVDDNQNLVLMEQERESAKLQSNIRMN
jgi:hypothetical protein